MNSRGQALIESVLVLPVIIALFFGLIYAATLTLSFYLTDHWVYQAHLCLASSEETAHCKKQMLNKLKVVPATSIYVKYFYKNDFYTRIQLSTHSLWFPALDFNESYKRPLNSKDFYRFGDL